MQRPPHQTVEARFDGLVGLGEEDQETSRRHLRRRGEKGAGRGAYQEWESLRTIRGNPLGGFDCDRLAVHAQAKIVSRPFRHRISTGVPNAGIDHETLDPGLLPVRPRTLLYSA